MGHLTETDEQVVDNKGRGVGRRAVVRGAVATAWAVPLVQVVAAPAFAAVSGPANISGTGGTISRDDDKTFHVQISVTNSGGSATSGLTATLGWTPAPAGSTEITSVTAAPGWTKAASGYTWTANTQATAGSPRTFDVTVTIQNAAKSGKVNSGNGNSGNGNSGNGNSGNGNSGKVKTGGTMTVSFAAQGTAGSVSYTFGTYDH